MNERTAGLIIPRFTRLHRIVAWRERRLFREMETKLRRMEEWPSVIPTDEVSAVREMLEMARHVFRAPRALLAWEEADEPYLNLAFMDGDRLRIHNEPFEVFEPVVHPELTMRDFYAADLGRGRVLSPAAVSDRIEIDGPPVHAELAARFSMGGALSFFIEREGVQGRLFLLDLPRIRRADFAVGRLLVTTYARRAQQVGQLVSTKTEAVAEERFSVARDLHDGLLQSFTGIVLQLETAHDLLQKDPAKAGRVLTQVEATIMKDQRDLRSYVDELRPRARRRSTEFDLKGRLDELQQRFGREWRIELRFEIGAMHPLVTQAIGQETFRMISEAVMNSAKHGQASKVDVELATREDRLWIRVRDDGIGFPFRGRYNLAALMEKQQGPAVLGERVAALNGDLIVESTEQGASLEISLPLGWRAEE